MGRIKTTGLHKALLNWFNDYGNFNVLIELLMREFPRSVQKPQPNCFDVKSVASINLFGLCQPNEKKIDHHIYQQPVPVVFRNATPKYAYRSPQG